MKKTSSLKISNVCLILILSSIALPGSADQETEKAVTEVQSQMKDPAFHKNAAKESKEAASVEEQVKIISGNPENEQEIYNLAAEVLGNMKDQTPEAMAKTLQEAQSNPAEFSGQWTPEQKKKLKELAERLPSSKMKNP